MEVDILIDGFTDCLIERRTRKQVHTEYRARIAPIKATETVGWKFDWRVTEKAGYQIYELFTKNDTIVQGRISLKIEGGVANVDIVESAPHNYGQAGKYEGVGGHLFAIACQVSMDAGCDGVVAFTAKSELVEYYTKVLNAKIVKGRRMYLDEAVAKMLIDKYMRK